MTSCMLSGDDLTTNRLKDFDAVVIGVRAFNVRTDLVSRLPALFDFVANRRQSDRAIQPAQT